MYTVASPDPSPRDGGQLPNPNKCNSTLTSGTRGEILTLTSGTSGSAAPTYIYIYTILQNKRMRRCVVPPPIIFERLKLPQQIIYRRKRNLSESSNHKKYWENILIS